MGNFTDEELDDVDDEVLDYKEASDDPSTSVTAVSVNTVDPANDGDKSPTREREAALTVKELQFLAKKLNLCHDTLCYNNVDPSVPTPHKRQTGDQAREQTGKTEPTHHPSHHPNRGE